MWKMWMVGMGLTLMSCGRHDSSSSMSSDDLMAAKFANFQAICEAKDTSDVDPETKKTIEAIKWSMELDSNGEHELNLDCQKVQSRIQEADQNPNKRFGLYIAYRNLTSLFPLRYFSTSVKSIDFSGNQVVDVTPVSHLQYLESIDASDNGLTAGDSIFSIRDVRHINASFNNFESFPDISAVTALVSLDMSHNQLRNFRGAERAALQVLNVSYQNDKVTGAPTLEYENPAYMTRLASDLDDLRPSLKVFSAEGISAIRNTDFLYGFQNISGINLRKTSVKEIKNLSALKTLRYVDLSGTKVSDKDLEALKDVDVQHLLVSENASIVDGAFITPMKSLKALSIAKTKVTSPSFLVNKPNLAILDFQGTPLNTSAIAQAVGGNSRQMGIFDDESNTPKYLTIPGGAVGAAELKCCLSERPSSFERLYFSGLKF